jgi:hypothetical protein
LRWLIGALVAAFVIVGCGPSTPSDADQQKMVKDWSPEKVAEAYEKAGKHKEAEEVRRQAQQSPQ